MIKLRQQHSFERLHLDYKAMYRDVKQTAELLETENTEVKSTVAEQQQRIAAYAREQQRLGAGKTVPQWVVTGMDRTIAALEVERDVLKLDIKRLTAARNELITQRDEVTKHPAIPAPFSSPL